MVWGRNSQSYSNTGASNQFWIDISSYNNPGVQTIENQLMKELHRRVL